MDNEVRLFGMGSSGNSRNPLLRALLPKPHLNSYSLDYLDCDIPPTRAIDLLAYGYNFRVEYVARRNIVDGLSLYFGSAVAAMYLLLA